MSDMSERQNRREAYTANHEAGHAVIGHMLGLACGSVTIVPDGGGVGCTTAKSPLATLDAWDARGRCRYNGRDLRSVYRAYIMQLMAGREAADLICGPGGSFTGDQDDIRQIETLIHVTYDLDRESWPSPSPQGGDFNLERLRKATRSLCIRHREKIERVAQALLKHKTLSPKAIDNLIKMPWRAQRTMTVEVEHKPEPRRTMTVEVECKPEPRRTMTVEIER